MQLKIVPVTVKMIKAEILYYNRYHYCKHLLYYQISLKRGVSEDGHHLHKADLRRIRL